MKKYQVNVPLNISLPLVVEAENEEQAYCRNFAMRVCKNPKKKRKCIFNFFSCQSNTAVIFCIHVLKSPAFKHWAFFLARGGNDAYGSV